MSESAHQLATYYKADGTALPNLPAGGDWPRIYGESGLSLTPPETVIEDAPEKTDEQLLDATASGPDTEPAPEDS